MKILLGFLLALVILPAYAELDWDKALAGDHRSEAHRARDEARHPRETLEFFGLREGMTVVELYPGAGWYTEVLAPLVTDKGRLYTAHFGLNASRAYFRKSLGAYLQKLAENHDLYGSVMVTQLQPPVETTVAPAGSVDLVMAFRNIHSWMRSDSLDAVLTASYAALKPGGTLGIVQHRGESGLTKDQMVNTGYVTEAHVIAAAEAAGFKLSGRSEINANSRDTRDHPRGVWSLPPSLAGGEEGREGFLAIGESDRMTLRFSKPE